MGPEERLGAHWRVQSGGVAAFDLRLEKSLWLVRGEWAARSNRGRRERVRRQVQCSR